MENEYPHVLAVGGVDPTCGAGIQMDLAVFTACRARGLTAVSAITVQNSRGISRVVPVSPRDLREQVIACVDDFPIQWMKTGILPTPEIVREIANLIREFDLKAVVDPIFHSGKGHLFVDDDAFNAYISDLCPLATIITPNFVEIEKIAQAFDIHVENQGVNLEGIMEQIGSEWNNAIIVKGGHRDLPEIVDLLWYEGNFWAFSHPRLPLKEIHGSGCFFSSAITAFCASGLSIPNAVADAEFLIQSSMQSTWEWNSTTFINPLQEIVMQGEKNLLFDEVRKVLAALENNPEASAIIPEVRSNISIILLGGMSKKHVAAIDGRITIVGGSPKAAGPVQLACSNHTARLLLSSRKVDPRIRGVVNMRHSNQVLMACKDSGMKCVEIQRQDEPLKQKSNETGTMEWIALQLHMEQHEFPDVVYDEGDVGKEPMIRLFGRSGEDLARKIINILDYLR
ncbi:MAG: bifunctional hydroxymethylpyrimidine kinase/phosphomethylpyrimidine kinase [Candidatus Hodarchaeota archaeon]